MSPVPQSDDAAGGTRKTFLILALLAVTGTTVLTLIYAGQPLLDRHAFRQTQTAITAYWFVREGYRLAYETPVAGYPWVMPFEFPIYQSIVAALTQFFDLSLSVVGRLVSYAFLLLCIPTVASINRRLGMPFAVLASFVALTFTTPVYVYWGRAVLIETSALFFGLMAIKYGLDYLLGGRSTWRLALFSLFMTFCMLQKATTALPILVVLAVVLAAAEVRQPGWFARPRLPRWIGMMVAFLVPLLAAYAWTSFTDMVKLASPLGPALTSSALTAWTWGTPGQRVSSALWGDVILTRVLVLNLGGMIGAGSIVAALTLTRDPRIRTIILTSLALGLLPLFLFSNLHIVHDYYQSSNVMFLTYGLAVSLGAVIVPLAGGRAGLVLLAALMAFNGFAFVETGYFAAMRRTFGTDNRDVAVSRLLARELPEGAQFVAFGNEYGATLAFLAGRKSFTVPHWFEAMEKVIASPGDYVEKGHLGAVVACSDKPDLMQLLDWATKQGNWKLGKTSGCAIAVPAVALPAASRPGECRGLVEAAGVVTMDGRQAIELSGWSATGGAGAHAPDTTFVELRGTVDDPLIIDTLRIPRPDINRKLGAGEEVDLGFSRVVPAVLSPGTYRLSIIQRVDGQDIACAQGFELVVP